MSKILKQYTLVKDKSQHPKLKVEDTMEYFTDSLESTEDIVVLMNKWYSMDKLAQERVYVLAFNSNLKLLGVCELARGGATTCAVPVRELFISLLLLGSEQFVVVHNHPNGDESISYHDKQITQQLLQGAQLLGMLLDDHIIIINDGYISLGYENLIC